MSDYLYSANVPSTLALFGQRYSRTRDGLYRDRFGRSPLQNWRARFFARTGRWPTLTEDQRFSLNKLPGSRFGLAPGEVERYGATPYRPNDTAAPPPPGQPIVPGAPNPATQTFTPPPPGFRQGTVPVGIAAAMQAIRGARTPAVPQVVTQAAQAARALTSPWGNAAVADTQYGGAPTPRRTGVVA